MVQQFTLTFHNFIPEVSSSLGDEKIFEVLDEVVEVVRLRLLSVQTKFKFCQ